MLSSVLLKAYYRVVSAMMSKLSQANFDGDSSSDQSLTAKKPKIYKGLDFRIAALIPEQATHIMTDESFREIYNSMKSIKDATAKMRINIIKTYPNTRSMTS